MFNTLMILLAEATQNTAQTPAGGQTQDNGSFLGSPLILVIPLIVLGYFLFLRPMRRQEQERAALLSNVKKNDKIITHAGIYGTVISVSDKEDEIVVKVDDNVRLKMIKNSILRNLTNEEAAKEAKAAKDAAKGATPPASAVVTTKEGGA